MKEATGELNTTVFVIIAVVALGAFFFTVIWPQIRNNMDQTTKCNAAICEKCPQGNQCQSVSCHLKDNPNVSFNCVWKG